MSLSERVAYERKERVGDVVGYQVKLDSVLPSSPGGMLFCTTGILLRKMQSNPNLTGCSHIIVDEAHERSVEIDMLVVLLKRALANNKDLKLVVMSATINSNLFKKYFDCTGIEVPGRMFPVEVNFLEDISKLGIKGEDNIEISRYSDFANLDCMQITELLEYITNKKPSGAILCFLPGWSDISRVKYLLEKRGNVHNAHILPLHSKVTYRDQKKIFEPAPENVRKIILATNIAETGITINDVVYVVDSCLHKEVRYDVRKGISSVNNYFVSQANIFQR